MNNTLPKDPFMLMSAVNMKLRDEFPSLDELCKTMGVDRPSLEDVLSEVGYVYNEELNKFW